MANGENEAVEQLSAEAREIEGMDDKTLAEEACYLITERFATGKMCRVDFVLNVIVRRFCKSRGIKPFRKER